MFTHCVSSAPSLVLVDVVVLVPFVPVVIVPRPSFDIDFFNFSLIVSDTVRWFLWTDTSHLIECLI